MQPFQLTRSLPLVCVVVAASFYLCRITYQFFKESLSNIPGPRLARVSRLWLFNETYKGSLPQSLIELHRKYGPVVRVAPGQYSIDDPSALPVLYGAGKPFIKVSPTEEWSSGPHLTWPLGTALWYEASGNPKSTFPTLFVERDPHRHSAFRRKVAAAYSMTNMVSLETFVDSCTELLLQKLTDFATNNIIMDVPHWTQCYAFDVIGKLTFGDRFGFLDEGHDIQGIMASLHQYLLYAARVGVYSEWHKWSFTLFQKISAKASGIVHVGAFARERIDARLNNEATQKEQQKNGPADFLTKLLSLRRQDPNKIDKDDIFAVCNANVGAGSDTTSISLNAVLYYLCKNPSTLAKLREEIATKEAQGEISDPITFQQGQNMPYLQAVIKEALRMHPAAAYPLMRVVPPGGTTIAGHEFPAGSILGISAWVAHANRAVFGEDAVDFRPERWLEDASSVKRREAYFLTFGSGSRTCIGKNISLMELTKVTPEIVKNFDFELESANSRWKTANVWFVKQSNFHCRIRKCRV